MSSRPEEDLVHLFFSIIPSHSNSWSPVVVDHMHIFVLEVSVLTLSFRWSTAVITLWSKWPPLSEVGVWGCQIRWIWGLLVGFKSAFLDNCTFCITTQRAELYVPVRKVLITHLLLLLSATNLKTWFSHWTDKKVKNTPHTKEIQKQNKQQ